MVRKYMCLRGSGEMRWHDFQKFNLNEYTEQKEGYKNEPLRYTTGERDTFRIRRISQHDCKCSESPIKGKPLV